MTIIAARFVPVVRAFALTMAGVTKLPYQTFLVLGMLGGLLWGSGITTLGFILGRLIPNLERYIYLALIAGVLVAVVPGAVHLLSGERNH